MNSIYCNNEKKTHSTVELPIVIVDPVTASVPSTVTDPDVDPLSDVARDATNTATLLTTIDTEDEPTERRDRVSVLLLEVGVKEALEANRPESLPNAYPPEYVVPLVPVD